MSIACSSSRSSSRCNNRKKNFIGTRMTMTVIARFCLLLLTTINTTLVHSAIRNDGWIRVAEDDENVVNGTNSSSGEGSSNNSVLDENITVIFGLAINFDHDHFHNLFNPDDNVNFRNFHSLHESRIRATKGLENCRDTLKNATTKSGLTTTNLTSREEYYEVNGTGRKILSLFKPNSLRLERFIGNVSTIANKTIVRAVHILAGEVDEEENEDDVVDLLENTNLRQCVGLILKLVDFPHVPFGPRLNSHQQEQEQEQGQGQEQQPGTSEKTANEGNRELERGGFPKCTTSENVNGNDDFINPQVLFQMYGVPSQSESNDVPSQSVYSATSAQVSTNDLNCFAQSYELKSSTLTGDYAPYESNSCGNSCLEPNLDTQYIMSMNSGVNILYQAYETIFEMILSMIYMPDDQLPSVVSISYSMGETNGLSNTMQQTCKEIGMLSGRGVSFFAAAGDWGATNSYKFGVCGESYSVGFPASCPFVTAVGGTTGFAGGTEIVCNSGISGITTGGGFSRIFTERNGFNLTFQEEQVGAYRKTKLGADSGGGGMSMLGYPTSGRGLPDISAAATNYNVKVNEIGTTVDGTSASTPVMAGITARAVLESGQRFGCINQVIYKNSEIFYDVKIGQNSGSGSSPYCPSGESSGSDGQFMGFEATDGWDAASGLGTLGSHPEGAYSRYVAVLASEPLPPAPPPTPAPPFSESKATSLRITISFIYVVLPIVALKLLH